MRWPSLLLCFWVFSWVRADEPSKLGIFVSTTCDHDTIGQTLSYKTKEAIRRSTTMRTVDTYAQGVFTLQIVCLTPDASASGRVSNYSFSLTMMNTTAFYDYAIDSGVGVCGTDRVSTCADGLVARIDENVSRVRAKFSDGTFYINQPPKKP